MKKTLLRFILTAFVGASTLAVSGQTVIQGMTPKNHRGLTQIAAPAKAPMKAHAFNTINDVWCVRLSMDQQPVCIRLRHTVFTGNDCPRRVKLKCKCNSD